MERVKASIEIAVDDEALASAICRALAPEASQPISERGRAWLECRAGVVTIHVRASDPGAARALINSYLYWIAGITSSIGEVSRHDRADPA